MGTIGFRSKTWIGIVRKQLRPTMSVVGSLLSMSIGSALVGLGVAGIATFAIELGSPVSAGITEGRSVAGAGGRAQSGANTELHVPLYVPQDGGEAGERGEQWEPRGDARICRTWCMVGAAACLDVCGVARGG